MGTSAGFENHNNELSPSECRSLCLPWEYQCMFVSAQVYVECVHVVLYVQEYVDHIFVINIHHGNTASGESFKTVNLQIGECRRHSERVLVSLWDRREVYLACMHYTVEVCRNIFFIHQKF